MYTHFIAVVRSIKLRDKVRFSTVDVPQLTVFTHLSTMSKPSDGSYTIYNRVLSPTGAKLAITYGGHLNESLTVSPLTRSSGQVWILRGGSNTTSNITPNDGSNNQIGGGSNRTLVVLSPGGYEWKLTGSDEGFVVQNGDSTEFWSLPSAQDGATVTTTGNDLGIQSRWVFEKVV